MPHSLRSVVLVFVVPVVLLVLAPRLAAQDPPSRPMAPADIGLALPTTLQEIAARRAVATERIESLDAAIAAEPPAGAPAEEGEAPATPSSLRVSLRDAWRAYSAALDAAEAVLATRAALTAEGRDAELEQRVAEARARVGVVDGWPPPLGASPRELDEARAELEEWRRTLTTLNEAQSSRTAKLSGELDERQRSLDAALAELRQRAQTLAARQPAAQDGAGDASELRELEARLVAVETARVELELRTAASEATVRELERQQDEPYREAVEALVRSLERRVAALDEASRRDRLEVLRLGIERASTPLERKRLELEYFVEAVLLRHFSSRRLSGPHQDRFPTANLEQLRHNVGMSKLTWDEICSTVGQRSGRDALQFREEARAERRHYHETRDRLETRLAAGLTDLHGLQRVRDQALRAFRSEADLAVASLPEDATDERARLEAHRAALRSRLYEEIKKVLDEASGVVARLKEGTALLDAHLVALRANEALLYDAAVFHRESGWVGLDWRAALAESRAIGAALVGSRDSSDAPVPGGEVVLVPAIEAALAGNGDAVARVEARLRDLGTALAAVDRSAWAWMVALMAIAGGLGLWMRGQARAALAAAAAAGTDAEPDAIDSASRVVVTVHRLGWEVLRRGALPIAVLVAGAVGVVLVRPRAPATAALLWLLGAMTLAPLALVGLRLLVGRRDRLLACSDRVAAHWRLWGAALVVIVAALLPLLEIANLLDVLPGLRSIARETLKTGVLAVLLAFLARRGRVLGILGRSVRQSWIGATTAIVYPLVVFAMGTLLALELCGYGILVEYVGGRTAASAVAIALVVVAVRYGNALLRWRLVNAKGDDAAADGEDTGDLAGTLRPLAAFARVVGIMGGAWLVLRIWGVPLLEGLLTWRAVMLSLLVLGGAVAVDRVLARGLASLQASDRLPEVVVRMIRRWTRGVLAGVVLLLLVAIAGLPIDNVWTLLSAGLAMIAIGFVAVWSLLGNITSTVIILIWRPFNIGEHLVVQPEGIEGEVVDINFMYTLLKGEDGERTTVPNSLFMQKFIRRRKTRRKPARTLAEQLAAEKPIDE